MHVHICFFVCMMKTHDQTEIGTIGQWNILITTLLHWLSETVQSQQTHAKILNRQYYHPAIIQKSKVETNLIHG